MCDLTADNCATFPVSTLTTPSAARTFVRTHGCPEHGTFVMGALELVTSELVTNSVLYGQPPITVYLACLGTEVRLAVSDAGSTLPDEQGTSGGLGLGLVIVAQIAREWGTTPLAVGKEVWCRVPTGMLPLRTPQESRVSGERPRPAGTP